MFDDVFPGLKKALLTMGEGESRLFYMHPDLIPLDNREVSSHFIVEIEVLEANSHFGPPLTHQRRQIR